MDEYQSLSHTKWECKYHVVFIPKCRRKTLYEQLRRNLGEVFHQLAKQKESRIEEGHLLSDHVHMMIAIPPTYAVSQVIGYIKGKSAIHVARVYGERRRNFVGQHFWARGYFVSTVGRDEEVIRSHIRGQEQEDQLTPCLEPQHCSQLQRPLALGGCRVLSEARIADVPVHVPEGVVVEDVVRLAAQLQGKTLVDPRVLVDVPVEVRLPDSAV